MIGGAEKYMAACRDCHEQQLELRDLQESKLKMEQKRRPFVNLDNKSELMESLFTQLHQEGQAF